MFVSHSKSVKYDKYLLQSNIPNDNESVHFQYSILFTFIFSFALVKRFTLQISNRLGVHF